MRLKSRAAVCAALLLGIMWVCGSPRAFTAHAIPAGPGPEQDLLPDENAAKAKQILQQVIAALGGQAYLNVRDSECDGRIEDFNVNVGGVFDFTDFRDLWLFPDKTRTEYHAKGEHPNILRLIMGGEDPTYGKHGGLIVTVFNGDQGWMLDKSGLSDQPEAQIKNFNEQLKTDMNQMLRLRLNEPGVEARYAGPDIIDLKEADWIEFSDPQHHEMRLGVERATHLPLRWVVTTRDPQTREPTEVTTKYMQFMPMGGVKAPLNLDLSRNNRRVTQTFLNECKFNSGLDPQLFTRPALQRYAAQAAKKGFKDSKSTK